MAILLSEKQKENVYSDIKGVRVELNEGTIRSGKTMSDALKMAIIYASSPDPLHLVLAYNQEQAYRMFMDCEGFGLEHIFSDFGEIRHDEHGDHLWLNLPTGEKRIYYKGGGKVNAVGAITGMSFGTVTFLEFNLLNKAVIEEAFRRTKASKCRFHLVEQNPPAPNHPNLETLEPFIRTGTYRFRHWRPHDNPILVGSRLKEWEEECKVSEYLYKRDWLGERSMPEGVIYGTFNPSKNQIKKLQGRPVEMVFFGDGGQQDATVCECYVITEHEAEGGYTYKLNQVATYYHSGRDTGQVKAGSTYAKEIQAFIKRCMDQYDVPVGEPVIIDPACRWLREELEKLGIDTKGADNNAHDVTGRAQGIEVGIERMQTLLSERRYLLVEQPNDQYDHYNWLQEIGMYVRDENSGKPVDKNNHAMDTSRYATNYFYRNYEDI